MTEPHPTTQTCARLQAVVGLSWRGVPVRLADLLRARDVNAGRKFAWVWAPEGPAAADRFLQVFGAGMACLAPQERLVVTGDLARSLVDLPAVWQVPGSARHLVLAPEADEACQAALSLSAQVLCLLNSDSLLREPSIQTALEGRHVLDLCGGDRKDLLRTLRECMARPWRSEIASPVTAPAMPSRALSLEDTTQACGQRE